jgi:hypothetical protein
MVKIIKNISLKTLEVLFSNGIIFMLNSLFYVSQIDNLDACASLINREGESMYLPCLLLAQKSSVDAFNYRVCSPTLASRLPGP